jgi:hypothetical protein
MSTHELVLTDGLSLLYPDGFHELDEAERSAMRLLQDGEWVGISDSERHMLVTVGWRPQGLAGMFLSTRDLAKNAERNVSKAVADSLYALEDFAECDIAGTRAHGFRYTYQAFDNRPYQMYGECFVTKIEKTIWYFNLYARAELRSESVLEWEHMLGTVANR